MVLVGRYERKQRRGELTKRRCVTDVMIDSSRDDIGISGTYSLFYTFHLSVLSVPFRFLPVLPSA